MAQIRSTSLGTRALLWCLILSLLLLPASCAKPPPSFEDLPPADELYAEGVELLKGRRILGLIPIIDYTKAIETFQSIIDNYPYSDYAVKAELQIADAYFADKRWDEALSYYRDFADLHPQHEKVPYTVLRSAECYVNQVETEDRDQTATREAIQFLEQLIHEYPYSPRTRDGEQVLHELRTRLSRSTMRVGDFYLDRGEYQSAAARYRMVLDNFPGLGLDAESLFKLGLCYENMERLDEALRLYYVVVENFRTTELAGAAQERIAASK